MWVYERELTNMGRIVYRVGYLRSYGLNGQSLFSPDGEQYDDQEKAARRVNFLNGGPTEPNNY